MSNQRITIAVGTVQQSRAHITTDADRDRYLLTVAETDTARVITRPSGRYEDRQPGQAAGWSGRQQAAARKLQGLWRGALPLRGLPMAYGDAGRAGGGCDDPQAAQEAWDGYCAAMDELVRRCSQRHADAVRLAVVYEEPSTLGRAHMVREGLAFLADWWGVR
jgi:hypothetical protein